MYIFVRSCATESNAVMHIELQLNQRHSIVGLVCLRHNKNVQQNTTYTIVYRTTYSARRARLVSVLMLRLIRCIQI